MHMCGYVFELLWLCFVCWSECQLASTQGLEAICAVSVSHMLCKHNGEHGWKQQKSNLYNCLVIVVSKCLHRLHWLGICLGMCFKVPASTAYICLVPDTTCNSIQMQIKAGNLWLFLSGETSCTMQHPNGSVDLAKLSGVKQSADAQLMYASWIARLSQYN